MRLPSRSIPRLGALLATATLAVSGTALAATPAWANDSTPGTEASSMTVERCAPRTDLACSGAGVIVTIDGQTSTTSTDSTAAEGTVGRGTGATAPSTTGSGDAAASSPAMVNPTGSTTTAATPVGFTQPATGLTAASAVALPDTGGSGTVLVMACVFLLLCGAAALALVHAQRRERPLQ